MLGGEPDAEMREYLEAEVSAKEAAPGRGSTTQLRELLVPRDPDDGKNVIVEIRGGEGGEEGNLWAADLFHMYERYADLHQLEGRGAHPPAVGHGRPAARSRSW